MFATLSGFIHPPIFYFIISFKRMNDSIFNENAGRFLTAKETQSLKEAYRNCKLACGGKEEEYTRSEFFGLDRVKQLLKQAGCVGIRVHYANRWENEDGKPTEVGKGEFKPRVLLTGVDARGRDLGTQPNTGGLKDDGDSGDMVVGDGWTCPKQCAT